MIFNTIPQDIMSPLVVGEGIRVWEVGGEEGGVRDLVMGCVLR